MPKFYTRYGKRTAVQLEFHFPGLTEQHHKDDCDINVIINRYLKTGELPGSTPRQPVFGDFTCGPQDYREAMDLVLQARERFESLPSAIRDRFGNDPEKLLSFLDDPANEAEARKLGLVATDPASDAPARDTTCAGATEGDPGASAEASGEASID